MADARKDCCKVETNLSAYEPYEGNEGLGFRRCSVCKCRHFRAVALGLGQQLKK